MEFDNIIIRLLCIGIFAYIMVLIHNHRLRIGYSWFLLLLASGLVLLSLWPGSLSLMAKITGSSSLLENLLFIIVLFLFVLAIHTSLVNSALTTRVKELSQEIALLRSEVADMHFPFNAVSPGMLASVHQAEPVSKCLANATDN